METVGHTKPPSRSVPSPPKPDTGSPHTPALPTSASASANGIIAILLMTTHSIPFAPFFRRWLEGHDGSYRFYVGVNGACPAECGEIIMACQCVRAVSSRLFLGLVTRGLLEAALQGPATHMILVSDTTLPVKTFRHVHENLPAGNTSFICVTKKMSRNWCPSPRLPRKGPALKHHQWMVLGRDHALLMAQRLAKEIDGKGVWGARPECTVGGDDEYYANTLLTDQQWTRLRPTYTAEGGGASSETVALLEQMTGVIHACNTYANFWNHGEENASEMFLDLCLEPGVGCQKPPRHENAALFKVMTERLFVEHLIRPPDLWFVRKVQPNATVVMNTGQIIDVQAFLISQLLPPHSSAQS